MKNKSYNYNVPVALVFFARPDVLKITFEAIRKARPNKLFLIQDGCREGRDDKINIELCRDIVSNVDWECEVFKNYSDINLGCGMRVFSGISWAFQYVDRLAIIEDDCVPSLSFFKFCEEILEKYATDDRMDMISGMNHLRVYDIPYDYFFTTSGSIWGWATWKRVWDTVDFDFTYINDEYVKRLITNLHGTEYFNLAEKLHTMLSCNQKLTSWSHQRGMNMLLNSRLTIVPKYNLISNIGLTENGANSVNSLKLIPKGLRRVFFMETYDMEYPLKHPKYVINDIEFKMKVDRIMAVGHPFVKGYRLFESVIYRIFYGDFKSLLKGARRRMLK